MRLAWVLLAMLGYLFLMSQFSDSGFGLLKKEESLSGERFYEMLSSSANRGAESL
jgi:hypothetical protein